MTTRHETAPGAVRRSWTARPLWQVGLGSAVLAAAASLLVYAIARAVGVPMELTEVFEDHFARMPVQNMAFSALLDGGVSGTVLALVCRRWTRRPRLYFLILTGIGFLASFAFPIYSDATTATKIALSIGHVVVAAIIVPALAAALPLRTTRRG
jgi:hypothetical protein